MVRVDGGHGASVQQVFESTGTDAAGAVVQILTTAERVQRPDRGQREPRLYGSELHSFGDVHQQKARAPIKTVAQPRAGSPTAQRHEPAQLQASGLVDDNSAERGRDWLDDYKTYRRRHQRTFELAQQGAGQVHEQRVAVFR